MNKQYFREGFKLSKTIHFCVVLVIGIIIALAAGLVAYKYNKYDGQAQKIFSDVFLGAGIWWVVYGTLLISINKGLGSSFRQMHYSKVQNRLINRIEKLKRSTKQDSSTQAEIKVLSDELENSKIKSARSEQKNNLIYWILILLGLIGVACSLILAFV